MQGKTTREERKDGLITAETPHIGR